MSRSLRWVTRCSQHEVRTTKSRPNLEPFVYRACVEDVAAGARTVSIEGQVADFTTRPRRLPRLCSRSVFDDRGHLIAVQLGGPDAPENLVPMHFETNQRGGWRDMEREVLRLLGARFGWMRVNVRYRDAVSLRPVAFTVELRRLHGASRIWQLANFASYLRSPNDPR
jgi:hypothetical protein